MALHCTMTYFRGQEDAKSLPEEWYHYLVVASPGPKPDSGVASIICLSEARAKAIAQGACHTEYAQEGGPAAALKQAERFLDGQHPGLNKRVSQPNER